MKPTDIFTPSDYPVHTYVTRSEEDLEERLRQALGTPGEVVSVSGPSKSGKTVLIEKVAGRDNLITLTGASISAAEDVWSSALDWMEVPDSTALSTGSSTSGGPTVSAEFSGGPPFGAQAKVSGSIGRNNQTSFSEARSFQRRGMEQVIREIGGSPFILFIDDFHYMQPQVQVDVARQIKEAARRGVKICTASVPHRSDDVVRSNSELRGRIRAVDTMPWSEDELLKIGAKGFPILGYEIPDTQLRTLARESFTSPQLMQAICLQICFTLRIEDALDDIQECMLTEEEISKALQETATRTDFASLLRLMHEGPKTRGTERKDHNLSDGSRGDVYRALLVAIKRDPPLMSLPWNTLSRRVQAVCSPDSPQASSLSTACSQIARIAREMYPNQRVVDWDGEPNNLLSIEDPYFLFYLRWSDKLEALKKGNALVS